MWVLVIIFLSGTSPVSFNAAGQGVTFDTEIQCVAARQQLLQRTAIGSGDFPAGQQAVCVRSEMK